MFSDAKRRCGFVLSLSILLALVVVSTGTARPGAMEKGIAAISSLHLNQIRMVGSHNSYRPVPSATDQVRIATLAPEEGPSLLYGHPPLEQQLALGLRQLEIDVAPDPQGGAFAAPYANADAATRQAMAAPGAKVLHIPEIDYHTHCLTFRACLQILDSWSDQHRGHVPIVVLVNASDFPANPPQRLTGAVFGSASIDALEDDIRAVIGRGRTVVPDDVRQTRATLREAVRAGAWPSIAQMRGKFVFVLDGTPAHEALLRDRHPSLKGRAMFGWFDENADEAAFFNIQDPIAERARIHALVSQGFVVRTRADANTVEARTHDPRRMQAALASGAQIISTDYYRGAPDPGKFGYTIDFGGPYVRCNDVVTSCTSRNVK